MKRWEQTSSDGVTAMRPNPYGPWVRWRDVEPLKVVVAAAKQAAMVKERTDEIPPDGWVTKLREVFRIDDEATWQDILDECAQTKRLAERATKEYFEAVAPSPQEPK